MHDYRSTTCNPQPHSTPLDPNTSTDIGSTMGAARNQVHCFTKNENGNQADPNPFYLTPTHYQQPISVRPGVELDF